MKNRIEEKCAEAKTAYEQALVHLAETRARFDEAADRAQPKRIAKSRLEDRISSVVLELEGASKDFDAVFEEAGYERTKPVKEALTKKAALQTELDALKEALVGAEKALDGCMVEIGAVGRPYERSYLSALKTYHRWKALEVLVDVAPKLVPVISAVSGIDGPGEDSLGRAPTSNASFEAMIAKRVSFIWDELVREARINHGVGDLPAVDEVGALNLRGFSRSKWLSPAEVHKITHSQR